MILFQYIYCSAVRWKIHTSKSVTLRLRYFLRSLRIDGSRVVRIPGTKSPTVAPNICVSSVWSLFRDSVSAPNIFRWFLDFWKTYPPLNGIMLLRGRVWRGFGSSGFPSDCMAFVINVVKNCKLEAENLLIRLGTIIFFFKKKSAAWG
jgi:hypothetical protein